MPLDWLKISWRHGKIIVCSGYVFALLGKKIDGNDIGIVFETSGKCMLGRLGLRVVIGRCDSAGRDKAKEIFTIE
jgi:hypothetical protein